MSEVETKTDDKGNKEQNQTGGMAGAPAEVKDSPPPAGWSLRLVRDEADIRAISSALKQTGWNRKRAAQLLSISYRGLLYKIRHHNIEPPAESS